MKKLSLAAACLFIAFAGMAQTIPNNGFENWSTETQTPNHFLIPTHWVTDDEIQNLFDPGYTGTSSVKTATSHSGSSAVLLQTAVSNGDTVNGIVFSTDSLNWVLADAFGGNNGLGFPDGVRSATLQGYYKFNGVGKDSAIIGVILTKWNSISHTRDTLVATEFETGTNQASYTALNITLKYLINTEYPDTAFIDAGITGPNGNLSHVGTTFYLDDLSFNGTVALGVNEISAATKNVSIYPNPFSDKATISISNSVVINNATIEVCDILGQTVKTISNINTHSVTLEKGDLQSGVYFYRLLNNNELVSTGKFVIE